MWLLDLKAARACARAHERCCAPTPSRAAPHSGLGGDEEGPSPQPDGSAHAMKEGTVGALESAPMVSAGQKRAYGIETRMATGRLPPARAESATGASSDAHPRATASERVSRGAAASA